jgi:hypothetical protein
MNIVVTANKYENSPCGQQSISSDEEKNASANSMEYGHSGAE